MCLGGVGDAIGDAFKTVDKVLSPITHPIEDLYSSTLGQILPSGVNHFANKVLDSPAEVAAGAAAAYFGGTAAFASLSNDAGAAGASGTASAARDIDPPADPG